MMVVTHKVGYLTSETTPMVLDMVWVDQIKTELTYSTKDQHILLEK